jgi:hypothetical protein
MPESFEASREGAVSSFQKKIAQIVEKRSKIDGTIVHVTDVSELGSDEMQAWELYGDLLRRSIADGAPYLRLEKEVMAVAKDFRSRLLQANKDTKVSRSFYYNWMINRLSVLAMNLPIAETDEKYTKEIVQNFTEELNEYFGS